VGSGILVDLSVDSSVGEGIVEDVLGYPNAPNIEF
jgi:hypothetical protein